MQAVFRQWIPTKFTRPLLLVLALFYLAFHAVSGERGLYAWLRESKRLEAMKVELADTIAQREAYERKIKLLAPESIDLDMLDEQAREVLGFAGPGEVVIYTDKESGRE